MIRVVRKPIVRALHRTAGRNVNRRTMIAARHRKIAFCDSPWRSRKTAENALEMAHAN
jgi:hypothetical protein